MAGIARWARNPGRRSAREPAPILALVILAVLARADRRPPPLVVAIPLDRLVQPLGYPPRGLPAELAHLGAGERVTTVVARAVGHVLDQRLVTAGGGEDPSDHVDVGGLVRAADVVHLARQA